MVGRFSTGSIEHQLLFGVDLSRYERLDFRGNGRTAAPLDLFDPVYDQRLGDVTFSFDSTGRTDALGVFVQDQMTIADNLKLLLGIRFDTFTQENNDLLAETETSQSDDAFSPRVGIVYQPIPAISLYASYSRSFNPSIGVNFAGEQFQPERGTQYEVGIKSDLNERLAATLALYDLTRSNVLTEDPDNPGFSIQTGEQRSQGIEFDISGEILPGWDIFAGYAYTDARVTEDNVIAEGTPLVNIPKNAFSLWTTYTIQTGTFNGLGFGLGLSYVSDRQGDLADTFEVPSYLLTDAAIFYERDQFRAALNFRNLFDVDYFDGGGDQGVFPGEPFTVRGTVSWQF